MKKITSLILVCLLLVGTALSLVSCAEKLSGKYENTTAGLTLEFKGEEVTITQKTWAGSILSVGTYAIEETEEGKKTITLDFSGENGDQFSIYSGTFDLVTGSDDANGKYIKIGFSPITITFTEVK